LSLGEKLLTETEHRKEEEETVQKKGVREERML
jgi:hypothetical protein